LAQLGFPEKNQCTKPEHDFAGTLIEISTTGLSYKRLEAANDEMYKAGWTSAFEQVALLTAMESFCYLEEWLDVRSEESDDPMLSNDQRICRRAMDVLKALCDAKTEEGKEALNAAFEYADSMEAVYLAEGVENAKAAATTIASALDFANFAMAARKPEIADLRRRGVARSNRRFSQKLDRPKVFVLPSVIAAGARLEECSAPKDA